MEAVVKAFFNGGHVLESANGCNFIYTDAQGRQQTSAHYTKKSCGNAIQMNGLPILDSILKWNGFIRTAPALSNGFEVLGSYTAQPAKRVIRRVIGGQLLIAQIDNGKWTAYPAPANTHFTPITNSGKLPYGSQDPDSTPEGDEWGRSASLGNGWPMWAKATAIISVSVIIIYAFYRFSK